MSKRLPYFQFEPAQWLAGDISFCSMAAQGLFINLCVVYWQRDCEITKEQFLKRFNNEDLFSELISEGIILIEDGKIEIKFLKSQFEFYSKKSIVNQINGSKGGRPKKPNETEIKPNGYDSLNPNETQTKPIKIREDKIREEKRREEKRREDKSSPNGLVDLKNQLPTEKINFDDLKKFFNANRGNLSELKLFSDARKTRIKNLEKKYGKSLIKIVIEKARDSDFLQGQNEKGWIASFDWITKPENFLKIAEDNYLNGRNGKPKPRHELTDAEIFTNALGKEAYQDFKFSK